MAAAAVSIDEALGHPFIAQDSAGTEPLVPAVLADMAQFRNQSRLRAAALDLIATSFSDADMAQLRAVFEGLDVGHRGSLTSAELIAALAQPADADSAGPRQLIAAVAASCVEPISMDSFLTAATRSRLVYQRHKIRWAFRQYDRDGSGQISREELRAALSGEEPEALERCMRECDKNGDGVIDFAEFSEIMLCGQPT